MSYTSEFHGLLLSTPSGERLSLGCFVLMSLSNLDDLVSEVGSTGLSSEPMAHVVAFQRDMVLRHVRCVFDQDAIDCPPPAANVAVADLPVPAVTGPVVGIPLSNGPVLALEDGFSLDVGVRTVVLQRVLFAAVGRLVEALPSVLFVLSSQALQFLRLGNALLNRLLLLLLGGSCLGLFQRHGLLGGLVLSLVLLCRSLHGFNCFSGRYFHACRLNAFIRKRCGQSSNEYAHSDFQNPLHVGSSLSFAF